MMNRQTLRAHVARALGVGLLNGAVFHPAIAQDTETAHGAIEEIIVTAQRREESLQQIPISVAVFDASALAAQNIGDVGDIGIKVPNLRMASFPYSPTTIRLFIRGVGSNETQVTQDPSVGVYKDGIYIGRSAGLSMDLADLERIEVLRGPQGTLYGRNTTGGAVNLVTAPPTGELGIKQELGAGNLGYWKSRTLVDLPAWGNLSAKVGYLQSSRDGLVENSGEGRDFGEDDKKGAMVALRWKPSESFTADYSFDWSQLDFTANYYQATEGTGPATGDGYGSLGPILPFLGGPFVEVPLEPDRVDSATLKDAFKPGDARVAGHSLTLALDTGIGTFKSLTAYRELEERDYQDFSANPTFTFFKNDPVHVQQEQFSQEFQWLGNAFDERLQFVTGLYYFREKGSEFEIDYSDVFFVNPPVFGDDLVITQRDTHGENTAYAVYGQGTWSFENGLSATVGARYTKDEREATKEDIFFPRVAHGEQDYSRFSPSLALEYQASDDLLFYGKAVSGYKSGGYNLRAGSVEDFERGFAEEVLVTYELGIKSQWADDRVRFNAALFRSDYDDIQVDIPNLFNPSQTSTFNAGEARIEGVEVDLTVAPLERMLVNLTYGYLDANFTEVIDPQTGEDITDDYVLPSAPKSGFNAGISYEFPQLSIGRLTARLDYSWQDKIYTQGNGKDIAIGAYIDSYGLLDARLTLADVPLGSGRLEFALWGRNLADKEWVQDSIGSFRGFVADRIAAYGEPRTYGLTVTYDL
jgi:iron complex outermembrane receptor protein